MTDDDDRRQRPLLVWPPVHYCRQASNNAVVNLKHCTVNKVAHRGTRLRSNKHTCEYGTQFSEGEAVYTVEIARGLFHVGCDIMVVVPGPY